MLSLLGKPTKYAHFLWREHLKFGDTVIDATCGQGFDTVVLAKFVSYQRPNTTHDQCGKVYAFDKHPVAVERTQERLRKELSASQLERVSLEQRDHLTIPENLIAKVCMEKEY